MEQSREIELKSLVYTEILKNIQIAQEHYGRDFIFPTVSFKLRGKVAGSCWYVRREIRINIPMFNDNEEDYILNTIPHEMAHLIAHDLYGKQSWGHGYYWQDVMIRCFQLDPTRCHDYDVAAHKVKRTVNYHNYDCGCRIYKLTTLKHNRAQNGKSTYTCRHCGGILLKEGDR